MEWIPYFLFNLVITLFFVPINRWKRLWLAGVLGVVLLFAIDSTFVGLGAYAYNFGNSLLFGIPAFYLLSVFFQSMLLAYYYPGSKVFILPYIFAAAAAFLLLEAVMLRLGYFTHLHWNLFQSYILDVFGLSIFLFFSYSLGAVGKGKEERDYA